MKKYNVGIVGYGWVSTAHIAAINATRHAQVTAVFSSRPLDAAALSARHGSEMTCFTELASMLKAPSIDVISICSLPHLHAEHGKLNGVRAKHVTVFV